MTRVVLPVEEVRRREGVLIAATPAGTPMQRAAHGIAHIAMSMLAERGARVTGARVALLVGTGNNGGDALYAGAILVGRGAQVSAVVFGSRTDLSAQSAFVRAGGRLVAVDDATSTIGQADLIIEGIVGIGCRGPLRDPAASVVKSLADTTAAVLAIDVPAGVDADTGDVSGIALRAEVTAVPGVLKPGLILPPGRALAGDVRLIDIGLDTTRQQSRPIGLIDDATCAEHWHRPSAGDDKYSRGVVGVCAGSAGYAGAAVLATGAARRGPTGYVKYAGAAADHVVSAWPEVVAIDGAVADVGRVQAWVVGPGLGIDNRAAALLDEVIDSAVPIVIDADGLTLLANDYERRARVRRRDAATVLTPHAGEFARIGGGDLSDRIEAVRALAADLDAVLLLKGSSTVVADPAGAVVIATTGSPDLATAGSGDVLAGLLGSLLASAQARYESGHGSPDALTIAGVAAHLHGLAGRLAHEWGRVVTARDVIEALRPPADAAES